MSEVIASTRFNVGFLISETHTCSYLSDQRARMLFVDPQRPIDLTTYTDLSHQGFRRNGNVLYAPHCSGCDACVPSRICMKTFKLNRSQRRCWRQNGDVVVEQTTVINLQEHYTVYANYINARHSDGDMYPACVQQFRDYLGNAWHCTRYLEMRVAGKLIGCAVIDMLENAVSATYTYFDPEHEARSLGTLSVLFQAKMAKAHGLEYVYLGYWIADCDKMQYKQNFKPLEVYQNKSWRPLK